MQRNNRTYDQRTPELVRKTTPAAGTPKGRFSVGHDHQDEVRLRVRAFGVPGPVQEILRSSQERRATARKAVCEELLDLVRRRDLMPGRVVEELDVEPVRVVDHQQHLGQLQQRVLQLVPSSRRAPSERGHRPAVVSDDHDVAPGHAQQIRDDLLAQGTQQS